jgi:hypothetical protein
VEAEFPVVLSVREVSLQLTISAEKRSAEIAAHDFNLRFAFINSAGFVLVTPAIPDPPAWVVNETDSAHF